MLSVPVHGQAARAQRRGCSRRPAARGPRCCVAAPPAAPAPASGGAEQSSEVAVAAAALPGSWAAARSPAEQRALLLAVIKPPLYSVALAPVLVGFAAAVVAGCAPQPRLLCGCALSACAVVAWLNLSNDAWDAETAVDAAKAESAVRLAGGNARAVARLASACLAAGVLGFVSLLLPLGAAAALPAAALAGALLCGVLYQAPPFRLSYRGLGEPLCFAAFGPLATGAFYAVAAAASAAAAPAGSAAARAAAAQAGRLFPAAVVAALLVGGTTTAILFCSHFHQASGWGEEPQRGIGLAFVRTKKRSLCCAAFIHLHTPHSQTTSSSRPTPRRASARPSCGWARPAPRPPCSGGLSACTPSRWPPPSRASCPCPPPPRRSPAPRWRGEWSASWRPTTRSRASCAPPSLGRCAGTPPTPSPSPSAWRSCGDARAVCIERERAANDGVLSGTKRPTTSRRRGGRLRDGTCAAVEGAVSQRACP